MTSSGLTHLYDMPALREVNLANTQVSPTGVRELLTNNRYIEAVFLSLDENEAQVLRNEFPLVKILNARRYHTG